MPSSMICTSSRCRIQASPGRSISDYRHDFRQPETDDSVRCAFSVEAGISTNVVRSPVQFSPLAAGLNAPQIRHLPYFIETFLLLDSSRKSGVDRLPFLVR